MKYLALFDYDEGDGGYTVTFPDFGWGVTEGKTLAEAEDVAAAAWVEPVAVRRRAVPGGREPAAPASDPVGA